MYKKHLYLVMILTPLLFSCSGKEAGENADAAQPELIEPIYQISFNESKTFGSTDEHLFAMRGYISSISDKRDYVYIPDLSNVIHVFDETGRHIAEMGRRGRGPGEFNIMSALQITPDHLYVYESTSRRVITYSLSDFTPANTVILSNDSWKDLETVKNGFPGRHFHVTDEGRILIHINTFDGKNLNLETVEEEDLNRDNTIQFFWLNSNGQIISDKVFEQKRMRLFIKEQWGSKVLASFEFFGKPIHAVSPDGMIAAAQSTEFKITIYNPEGRVHKIIDLPFKKAPLKRETLIEDYANDFEVNQKAVREMDLPATYPALEKMIFDEKNQLWVAAIVDDLSVYEWFIFNLEGDLMAQFTWDRDKRIRDLNGGFMYALQKNEIGEWIIVRYEIELTEH